MIYDCAYDYENNATSWEGTSHISWRNSLSLFLPSSAIASHMAAAGPSN